MVSSLCFTSKTFDLNGFTRGRRYSQDEWDADHLPAACEAELAAVLPVDHNASNPTLARSRLYGRFARGISEQGLTVFGRDAGGATSQGLGLSALFDFNPKSGKVTSKLERLEIPVVGLYKLNAVYP